LRRLASSKFLVVRWGPWGTAFDDFEAIAALAGPSSWSVAIGEDLPEEVREAFPFLFLAMWRGPVFPLLTPFCSLDLSWPATSSLRASSSTAWSVYRPLMPAT
jgi:hypothetical protein